MSGTALPHLTGGGGRGEVGEAYCNGLPDPEWGEEEEEEEDTRTLYSGWTKRTKSDQRWTREGPDRERDQRGTREKPEGPESDQRETREGEGPKRNQRGTRRGTEREWDQTGSREGPEGDQRGSREGPERTWTDVQSSLTFVLHLDLWLRMNIIQQNPE